MNQWPQTWRERLLAVLLHSLPRFLFKDKDKQSGFYT